MLLNKENGETTAYNITLAEMEKIVSIKAAVLGLVHLKRLDIGSVDGVKVYRVKRS